MGGTIGIAAQNVTVDYLIRPQRQGVVGKINV
jgi:hypothetical protein